LTHNRPPNGPDVLAYMTFPKEHRAKLYSTNPIERLNARWRRTDVVGFGEKSWVLP
jgi:transposase-like protein